MEDEAHFLVECIMYDDLRCDMMNRASEMDMEFRTFSSVNKLCFFFIEPQGTINNSHENS